MTLRTARKKTYAIIDEDSGERHTRWFARFTAGLVCLNVLAVIIESIPSATAGYQAAFDALEISSLVFFTIEFALRVWTAPDHYSFRSHGLWRPRLAYIFSANGLIDLVSVLPFWIAVWVPIDLRTLSSLRIVRLLKLGRYSPALRSLIDALSEERRALAGCFVILVGATLLFATGMHVIEGKLQPDKFGTIPDAMWWAIVTLGTVGYGDAVPLSPAGKFLASLAIFSGLIMVALPIGIVASAFSEVIHKRDFIVGWGMLARVPLFANLKAADIADIIKLLRARQYSAGELIVRRGDVARSMYFVADGEVRIELGRGDGPKSFVLGTGHFFGEAAVLRKTRRSANIQALSKTRLLVLDASDLHDLMARNHGVAQEIQKVVNSRTGGTPAERAEDLTIEELTAGEKPA